ncbi:MAG: sensor histidine kinase [Myxococcales bacterium]|nr:histidine kinase [Myxococcales bacterium]
MQRARPPRLIWCLAAWTAIALFFIVRGTAARMAAHESGFLLALATGNLMSCWLWAFLTPAIWSMSNRFPFERPGRDAAIHAAAALAIIPLDAAFEFWIVRPVVARPVSPFWRLCLDYSWVDIIFYVVVVALERMNTSRAESAEQAARAANLESDLRQARLRALEAQLRPHFLFNALNTISSLVRGGQDDAAVRAVAALGDVLRGSLRRTEPEVALRDELTLARRYLDLERARFGEAVSFTVEADEAASDALVPSLLLQPLVENALKHGRGRDGRARIEIRARSSGERLHLEVQDGGSGPAPGAPEGIGLSNTRARLEQLYGAGGRLDLRAAPGGGALAVVELPLREAPHA